MRKAKRILQDFARNDTFSPSLFLRNCHAELAPTIGGSASGGKHLAEGAFSIWATGPEDVIITSSNTPLDALFVTPPAIQGFRYWSQRSQLPDWKDGGLGNYDARFGAYFLRVMKAYGLYPGMNERYLDQVSGQQIIAVGRQFGADYALLPNAEPELPAMTVFTNNQWRIVRLN